MQEKLSKAQFMSKVITHDYEKKRLKRESGKDADAHIAQNVYKNKRRNGRI